MNWIRANSQNHELLFCCFRGKKIIYTDTYSWPDRDSYCCSSRPLPLALSVKNRDYVKRKSNHASIISMKTEKTDTSQSTGFSIYSVAHTTPAHYFFSLAFTNSNGNLASVSQVSTISTRSSHILQLFKFLPVF